MKSTNNNYEGAVTKHPLYPIWKTMRQRCNNPNNAKYPRYGGRGITICQKWSLPDGEGFLNFVRDMGEKPFSAASLDRRDNDGNYEPTNCKWSSYEEQARNRGMKNTNTSGCTGVNRNIKRGKVAWVGRIRNKDYNKERSFSVGKYGEEQAYQLACDWRKDQEELYKLMIEKLNALGAGYGENHGK